MSGPSNVWRPSIRHQSNREICIALDESFLILAVLPRLRLPTYSPRPCNRFFAFALIALLYSSLSTFLRLRL